jgi:predicted secreted protein
MFDDERSKRVILVAHCLLNQNARIDRYAFFPGAMGKTAQVLIDSGVGILQMPCPELLCLGLDREGHQAMQIGIREALAEEEGRACCQQIARHLVYQIQEYRRHGFEIVGVVGNDGSPACGVDRTYDCQKGQVPGAGTFIAVLREELTRNDIHVPFIAVQDLAWEENAARLEALLGGTKGKDENEFSS